MPLVELPAAPKNDTINGFNKHVLLKLNEDRKKQVRKATTSWSSGCIILFPNLS